MATHTDLYPRLIVSNPDEALDFYNKAMNADVIERFTDAQNRVVHAAFSIGDAVLALAQSEPGWGLIDPMSLGGSPCLLHLSVCDPDKMASAFQEYGGQLVVSIEDRPWGKREGRVADPSGHLWILSKTIEDVDAEEIQRRLDST